MWISRNTGICQSHPIYSDSIITEDKASTHVPGLERLCQGVFQQDALGKSQKDNLDCCGGYRGNSQLEFSEEAQLRDKQDGK